MLGGIIVFVAAVLVAIILRRELLFSAFSMVLYNLLVSFILSLSVIVSINKKELLILVLNAYGLNEKLIRWRSNAWALVIIMCVLECFIGTTNITQNLLDRINMVIEGEYNFLINTLGSLKSARKLELYQDPKNPDTVILSELVEVPYPVNKIMVNIIL